MIKIKLNKKIDKEVYKNFWDFSVAGVDFGIKIKNEHPEINLENYENYIDLFYKTNLIEIKNKQKEIQYLIDKKEYFFMEAVKNNLKINLSKLNYTGYLSIFNCNPRFLENKTFQVFYKRSIEAMLEVVLHESLHFIFFDFCDKELKKETGDLNKNYGPLWELSEIFNVIILNLPDFRIILGQEEFLFYPDLEKKLNKIKGKFNKKTDLKNFIIDSLKDLKQ